MVFVISFFHESRELRMSNMTTAKEVKSWWKTKCIMQKHMNYYLGELWICFWSRPRLCIFFPLHSLCWIIKQRSTISYFLSQREKNNTPAFAYQYPRWSRREMTECDIFIQQEEINRAIVAIWVVFKVQNNIEWIIKGVQGEGTSVCVLLEWV